MHNNLIENPNSPSAHRADRKRDLQDWDEDQAQQIARQEGIQLSESHWQVIHFLRNDYLEHGPHKNAREVADKLDKAFAAQGGRKYLRKLFPNGPVTQGTQIAGLPIPPYNEDEGFGISY